MAHMDNSSRVRSKEQPQQISAASAIHSVASKGCRWPGLVEGQNLARKEKDCKQVGLQHTLCSRKHSLSLFFPLGAEFASMVCMLGLCTA